MSDKEYERKMMSSLKSIEDAAKSGASTAVSISNMTFIFALLFCITAFLSWREDRLYAKTIIAESSEQACIESCLPIAFHSVNKSQCYCDPDGIVLNSWVRDGSE